MLPSLVSRNRKSIEPSVEGRGQAIRREGKRERDRRNSSIFLNLKLLQKDYILYNFRQRFS